MKSRAVTLFDGYAYVNGQLAGGGEYGNIDISGFTTVGTGPVNMKLGVMAAEGDRNLNGDYLAVQKLTADPNKAYNNTNYWAFNTAGLGNTTITQNFFNSSVCLPFQILEIQSLETIKRLLLLDLARPLTCLPFLGLRCQ